MKRRFIYTRLVVLPEGFVGLLFAGDNYGGYIAETDNWSWGDNIFGQLGNNAGGVRYTPVSLLGNKKTFCKISAGYYHTLTIQHNGQVWTWGYNLRGQLGDNSVTNRATPVSLLGNKKTFCKIATGNNHSLGIQHNGQVWGWGLDQYGNLGDNSTVSRRTPVSIHGGKKTFCHVSGGFDHSLGIDYTGQVWGWGFNSTGQIGDNSLTSRVTPVSILGGKKTFCQITGGIYHSLGIDYTGQVWSWGTNIYGQLGNNTITSRRTPASIHGGKKTFCQISAGRYHVVGVDFRGLVWAWGINVYGQIGDNTGVDKHKCTPVSILGTKKTFCKIMGGGDHSMGVDFHGQVWAWGFNQYGQLGNGTGTFVTPLSVHGSKKTFCQISHGNQYTSSVDKNGQVWTWGHGSYGKLGINNTASRLTPVSILGNKKTFCRISGNNFFTHGIQNSGIVWGWGYNNYGQLGNNAITSQLTPVSILGSRKSFVNIFAGISHTLGIQFTGIGGNYQIWSWGYNSRGQLGDNSVTSRLTPVEILGNRKTFCQIYGGEQHSISLDKNSDIWCWGNNIYGQLGDNSVTSRLTPVSVAGTEKIFCQISSGKEHLIAIDNAGQIWSWGYNLYGMIGDNTVTSRRTPVSILGSKKTFCQISGGYSYTAAIDFRGLVWAWGINTASQLGDNTLTSRRTPVSILGSKKTFCKIATGSEATIGIEYNGQIWGWGNNTSGQLGIIYTSYTPVRVYNF